MLRLQQRTLHYLRHTTNAGSSHYMRGNPRMHMACSSVACTGPISACGAHLMLPRIVQHQLINTSVHAQIRHARQVRLRNNT